MMSNYLFSLCAAMDPTTNVGIHRNRTFGLPTAAWNSAGPGHKSAIAHPIPKIAAPNTKLLSIVRLVGTEKLGAMRGVASALDFFITQKSFTYWYEMKLTTDAAPNTVASVASHVPLAMVETFKKAKSLDPSTI
jgi:hypothetical protein